MKRHLHYKSNRSHLQHHQILRLPRKLFSWWILVTYETSFTISEATEVILQHHQILRLPWKLTAQIWQKFVENSWNVIHNARQSSASSCKLSDLLPFHPLWTVAHQALNPSVRNPPRNRGYFPRSPLAFCLKKCNVSRCGCLSKFHQYCACSEKWYLNTAPAAKSHTLNFTKFCACNEKWPLNFSWLCYYYSCLIWLYYYLTLPLLFLDSTITWLYYYLLLLLLDSAFTWLSYSLTWFYYHLTLLLLDLYSFWVLLLLDSTFTWFYYYLALLLLDLYCLLTLLVPDSTITWLYYYLTLLLPDSAMSFVYPKFLNLNFISFDSLFFSGPGEEKKQTLYSSDWLPKKLSWTGRFDGRWPAGLPWWLGKRCWCRFLRDRFLGEKFSWRPSTDHDKKQGIPEGSSRTMSFFAGATGILWGFKKGL